MTKKFTGKLFNNFLAASNPPVQAGMTAEEISAKICVICENVKSNHYHNTFCRVSR